MESTPTFHVHPSLSEYEVPLPDLRAQHGGVRLVVGVAVASAERRVLLVQRAATEDVLPGMFELPGGNVEDGDGTILDTVARETKEETGMVVTAVVSTFEGFRYTTKRGPAVQINFVVHVENSNDVVLNAEEHQAHAWVGREDDLSQFPMTDEMKAAVLRAISLL